MLKQMIIGAAFACASVSANAATLVGAYAFNGTLASSQPGGPTLGVIDPLNASGFGTDIVFGQSRTVWNFGGNSNPTMGQSGLTFDHTGVTANSYSVALTFKFNEGQNAWRRIIDVQGRQSDNGFYVDPSNHLDIFPVSGSGVDFNSGVYRNVVLTVNGTTVSAYIDGGQSFSTTTAIMQLGMDPLILFADNVVGGGQGEWSSGSIAALRVYDGVLTQSEITELNRLPFVTPTPGGVPEPATWAMIILGFGLLGAALRSQRRALIAA